MLTSDQFNHNQVKHGAPIKVKEQVFITAIINEQCVFIRSKAFDENFLMNEIYGFAKASRKLEMCPEVGDMVIARHFEQYFRAEVLELFENEKNCVVVKLIDFGHTARLSIEDLFCMSNDCRKLECSAFKVYLKDVKIAAINIDIVNYLVRLWKNKTELSVLEINGDVVVLTDKFTSKIVNKEIVDLSTVAETSNFNDNPKYVRILFEIFSGI